MFLYFFYSYLVNPGMGILHLLTFSSIIAAVDPVAVLAVFDDVNVDKSLYYLVFGEALLNDGVTFVMFEGFKSLAVLKDVSAVPVTSYASVALSFITSPLGGVLCGVICGWFSGFFTKFTSEKNEYLEPCTVL
ncbi:sodium/hydrogen exchanger 2 [Eurytemora carolleeae]|uniref:sodium/hydrogen exchanger 2 n=1 Tax=Eurytemora carolleeae TaxID=1294199 RepID=UPI000C78952C|nr:sodium/hydrogen exchanger 2 [Eurytemora carolleeae]|eukprot:XP_023334390.1 sodium/hydrogen exchanger 2-like [Eurytemora affinis]